MALGIILGLGSVALGGYGAYSANQAKDEAAAATEAYNESIADAIATVEGNLEELYGEQSDPAELFREILTSYPEILGQILPALSHFSTRTASDFTQSNVENFQSALNQLYPYYGQYQSEQARIINELNPANLGQEEILAQTRMISPLVPANTFDPATGAVQGGTTNPVSLYRNLISGMYNERRTQYLDQLNQYLSNAENSAYRQEEKASSFLGDFLNLGFSSTSGITDATLEQEQNDINAQYALLNTLFNKQTATTNTSSYDALISQSLNSALSGLATAYSGYKSSKSSPSTTINISGIK